MGPYDVLVVEMPTKKEVEDEGKSPRIALGPVTVIASDEASAGFVALSEHKEEVKVNAARLKVYVRPFA